MLSTCIPQRWPSLESVIAACVALATLAIGVFSVDEVHAAPRLQAYVKCKPSDADCNVCAKNVPQQFENAFRSGAKWDQGYWWFNPRKSQGPANREPGEAFKRTGKLNKHIQTLSVTNSSEYPLVGVHSNKSTGSVFFIEDDRGGGKCPSGYKNDGATCREDVKITSRPSYGRGVGKPMGCASSEERDGALCYPKCKEGYNGVGPVCWQKCPSGYKNDGATCRKPGDIFGKKSYGRGVGKVFKSRCSGDCEKDAGLWYKKCKEGYNGRGPVCWQKCPSGYKNDGATCRKPVDIFGKKSYGRGVGKALHTCGSGKEKDAGLCYTQCKKGYNGVGPVCWGSCPAGTRNDGATCRKPAHIFGHSGKRIGKLAAIHSTHSAHPSGAAVLGKWVFVADKERLWRFDVGRATRKHDTWFNFPSKGNSRRLAGAGGGLGMAKLADGRTLVVVTAPGDGYRSGILKQGKDANGGKRHTRFFTLSGAPRDFNASKLEFINEFEHAGPSGDDKPPLRYSENLSLVSDCDGTLYTIHSTGSYKLSTGTGWWRLARVLDGGRLEEVDMKSQPQRWHCHQRSSATVSVNAQGKLVFTCSERDVRAGESKFTVTQSRP